MYLFGAACPIRGEAVGYLMPTANTFCMNLHLAEISRSVASDVQVALVLDGAGWHSSKELRVPDNITLIPLPPYSPELNPMEFARSGKYGHNFPEILATSGGGANRPSVPPSAGVF